MASPQMRGARAAQFPPANSADERYGAVRRRAGARLLGLERTDEVYPVLLEEIVALGFMRALVLAVDLETGDIRPAASLNCSRSLLKAARTTIWAAENPVVAVLHGRKPSVLASVPFARGCWYCHPILFHNPHPCWEAQRDRGRSCLAVSNHKGPGKLQLHGQVCSTCDMRGYAAAVLVMLRSHPGERQLRECSALVEMGNRCLSRLFKVEHYYNRMRDMENTIAQMQTVMQSMADPVILTDSHYRVIAQNRAAEKFFKAPEDVSEGGRRAVELNNLLFSAALSSMAVSGTEGSRDLTLVDVSEGEEVLFEAVCAPTYSHEGLRAGIVTVMRDVTDLRRADQELRASLQKLLETEEVVRQDRDRLNLVIENVGDPIVVADSAANVVLLDARAKRLFGNQAGSADDSRGEAPEIVKNQAKLDAYLTSFTFSFHDKETAPLVLYDPESRSEVEYEARSGKIYDTRGQVSYTVTVLRDFSAWKKLEQLKMERRMLEMEKFAATGLLAGSIAHEINNPMDAIKNAIFLLEGQVKPEAEEIYGVLKTEIQRVARIVRQMLGLYRSSERVAATDLNSVIEDTLALFHRQLERNMVHVRVELGKLPPVVGSADQFRQVMSNLVVNANDAMPNGGELIIRTRHVPHRDGVHGWARILVADSGSGIPKNLLKHLFDPFVSSKGEKGTGLGLWIVKGIVDNHGGTIQVRSREGRGSIFKIDLPVVR